MASNDDNTNKTRIMNDPIHNTIYLHPIWCKIIDTSEFQRLRYVKQLGSNYFVYPSATHTRFEHSIGVCHLAWRMARHLKKHSPDINMTDPDVLCVSIAGLCHDLGHGPFSHTWERFMERVAPEKQWKHENMSIHIFERIWNKLNLDNDPHLGENARKIICDIIRGTPNLTKDIPEFENKDYLFEIVANKKNEVDVDKWDYFARDAYYVRTANMSVQHERLLKHSRVLIDPSDNKNSIHYRDLELLNVYHMFYSRWLFHQRVCKHRVCVVIEGMIIDALEKANSDLFKGKKLSDCVDDIDEYLNLNDSIFNLILLSLKPDHEARKLIERIQNRNLYKCQGCAITPLTDKVKVDEIKEFVLKKTDLKAEDFYIDQTGYDYCMKNEDPVKDVPIFDKEGKSTQFREHVPSLMIPNKFNERKIWFISRSENQEKQNKLKEYFNYWFIINETKMQLRKFY